ncbi:MAG TPA: FAD-dependent oxidoreductase [Pyrinomonadaceae bacterium]|nr:FAD-dependent oxidoreductase [Pyrinomonadaceae bacterium]
MIGKLNDANKEVAVVGAGISGLLAAYQLHKRGYRVTILEESERVGGLLRTDFPRFGMAEAAANSLLASPAVTEVCAELSVELTPVRADSKARYILRDGQLRKFPLSMRETAGVLRRAAFVRAGNHFESQDLEAWGVRHLGSAAVDYLLTPFVRGIYGVQPEEVGLLAAFPKLLVEPGKTLLGATIARRMRDRGPKKPRAHMVAPRFGMRDLVSRLETHLRESLGDRFVTGVKVPLVPDFPNVVITIPAYRAAELFESSYPKLAEQLRGVAYTPMISVTAFVQRELFSRVPKGVGVLVPACEQRNCLGVLFSSSSFTGRVNDENQYASFTIMMGGSTGGRWLKASDEEIGKAVAAELRALLGMRGSVAEMVINRWPRGIPKYTTDLPKVWAEARQSWCSVPGNILFGNYTGQVSLRGMIESAAGFC